MRTREFERLIRKHSREALHAGFAECSCALAKILLDESIRRANRLEKQCGR